MDLRSLNFSEAEERDLRSLALRNEWTQLIKLSEELFKKATRELINAKTHDESQLLRGEIEAYKRLRTWIYNIYTTTREKKK